MARIFSVVSTVLGSVIGAGFSTGQEVFYFFTQFKEKSFLYIAFSSICMLLILLYFVNIRIENKLVLKIFKVYILLFSVVSLTVMFSAFGQLGKEFFGASKYVFTLLCFTVSIAIFKRGLKAVINMNKIVVSTLIFVLFLVFLRTWCKSEVILQLKALRCLMPKDFLSHIIFPMLYSTYNSLLAFPVVNELKSKFGQRNVKVSILLASVIILLLLSIINTVLLLESDHHGSQLPLLNTEKNTILQSVLISCAFLEILTTVLANYMGLSYSIKSPKTRFLIIIISLVLGFYEFQELLRKLYSLMGYIGFGIIILLSLSSVISKDRKLK